MSSTGRGPRLGGPDDVYETPAWCVDRLLDAWEPPAGAWLEPGAGSGAIIRAVKARLPDVRWMAVEARATCRPALESLGASVLIADFLEARQPEWSEAFVVLGNPPFHSAIEFVRRSMEVAPSAHVALLLRLAFLASEERGAFMRSMPPDVYVLSNRPSFTPNGKTDSADYGWFVWPPGERAWGGIRILGSTPKSERCRP